MICAIENIENAQRLQCFTHTLQLAVKDAEEECPFEYNELFKKVSNIVRMYNQSSVKTRELEEIQEAMIEDGELDQDCPLTLLQYNSTRFNSRFMMMERFLDLREPLSQHAKNTDVSEELTQREWKQVAAYVEVFKTIQLVTKRMEADKVVTSSQVIPVILGLKNSLDPVENNTRGSLAELYSVLWEAIWKRFSHVTSDDILSTAMLLDPRFKDSVLEDAEAELAKSKLLQIMIDSCPSPTEEPNSEGPTRPKKRRTKGSV